MAPTTLPVSKPSGGKRRAVRRSSPPRYSPAESNSSLVRNDPHLVLPRSVSEPTSSHSTSSVHTNSLTAVNQEITDHIESILQRSNLSSVTTVKDIRVLLGLDDVDPMPPLYSPVSRLDTPRFDNQQVLQRVMQLLQSELDDHSHTSSPRIAVYRKRCLRFLRYLSKTYHVLPHSLIIQDVRRDGSNPVAGGGFADIWRGTVGGGMHVCLKVLRLVIEQDEGARMKLRKKFCHEALVWRQLKHPNILPLLGVNSDLFMPSFCLISPWMSNKDIITFLKHSPGHDLRAALGEIASALQYLHSREPPIVHGDIRGANILVTDSFQCCLADFGLSLVTADSRAWSNATASGTKGAIRWMAPECIVQDGSEIDSEFLATSINTSRDVYAFGCTVVEILTQRPPFHDRKTDVSVLFSVMNGQRPSRPQGVWCPDALWELVVRCWAPNPVNRPGAGEIVECLRSVELATTG